MALSGRALLATLLVGMTAIAPGASADESDVDALTSDPAVVALDQTPAAEQTPAVEDQVAEEPAVDENNVEEPGVAKPSGDGEVAANGPEPKTAEVDGSQFPAEVSSDSPIMPLALGPDGASPPYAYWKVVDTEGNMIGGASFEFQGRTNNNNSWSNNSLRSVGDCVSGTCTGVDRDVDPGEFLAKWVGSNTPGQNPSSGEISAGSRYRIQPVNAPAGYKWVGSTGWVDSSNIGWIVSGNSRTLNFGTFVVEELNLTPVCEAGYVYSVDEYGQILQVSPSGVVTDFGSSASSRSLSFNGLGIGAGGSPVFGYARDQNNARATIWQFDTTTGTWTSTSHEVDSRNHQPIRQVGFVAGAVNLNTGTYFLGGYGNVGNTRYFQVWEYDPATNNSVYKGRINAGDTDGSANGDMAFDKDGNLFIVRGSGSTTTIISVTAADLAAANGGTIPSSAANPVTNTTSNVNGVAFDAAGYGYLSSGSTVQRYGMPGWTNRTNVTTTLGGGTDLASCGSPPTISVYKYIEGERVKPGDQFKLTLNQGGTEIASATTTGGESGLQDENIGPIPTIRNVELSIAEVAAGTTNLNDYASSYRCYVDEEQVTEGDGTSISLTVPSGGDEVLCTFYNSPLIANVLVHKNVTDTAGATTPRHGWTVGAAVAATTGTATSNPTAATQQTNASGDATWQVRFGTPASRATVTVSETQQPGYAFESGVCVVERLDGTSTTTQVTEAGTPLSGIKPGDQVNCTYVNKAAQGSVSWSKVDETGGARLAGSEWSLQGPGTSGPSQTIEDCTSGDCAGLADKNPAAGEFRVEGLAWGSYTLTETKAPEGYEISSAPATFAIDASNATTVIDVGLIENARILGKVTWSKVDDGGALLAGSEWSLHGPGTGVDPVPVTDCTSGDCAGLVDQDPVAGQFVVEDLAWGDYVLTETKAPAGYQIATDPIAFTVDAATTVIDLGHLDNIRLSGSVIWQKVDATDATLLAGSVWQVTGPNGFDVNVTDCIEDPGTLCAGPDMDPVAGQFKLDELSWGDYLLREITPPVGYELIQDTVPFAVGADTVEIDLGPQQNVRLAGSVEWQKADPQGNALAGSEWKLTGPDGVVDVDDCIAGSADECTGPDRDPAAGGFLVTDLAWGSYSLVETWAPAGYELDTTEHEFTISATHLHHEFEVAFVNEPREGPRLPLTGGIGRDFFTFLGLSVLGLGGGAALMLQRRNRLKGVA